jgi:type IV pilus assembly protein PilY1
MKSKRSKGLVLFLTAFAVMCLFNHAAYAALNVVNKSLTAYEGQEVKITDTELKTTGGTAPYTYTIDSGPTNGQVVDETGTPIGSFTDNDMSLGHVRYSHDGSETTSDSFAFTVKDNVGATASDVLTINVTPVNDEPVANAQIVTAVEDVETAITLTGNDGGDGGQSLTYIIASLPGTGTLSDESAGPPIAAVPYVLSDDDVYFTTALDDVTQQQFNFRVQDDGGTSYGGDDTSPDATVTVNITPVNDNDPVATADTADAVLEGGTVSAVDGGNASVLWNDDDDDLPYDTLTVTTPALSGPSHASAFTLNADGTFSYTHDGSENFSDSFTYELQDANGGPTDTAVVTVNITPVNDEPSFNTVSDVQVLENAGVPQTIAGWATGMSAGPADESGQTLTFIVTGNTNPGLFSAGPTIDATTGNLTFTTVDVADSASAEITIELEDDGGTANGGDDTSPPQTFTIEVRAVYTLTINWAGTGGGSVDAALSNDPVPSISPFTGGASTGPSVSYTAEDDDVIELTATPAGAPAPGSRFKGWSGDETSTSSPESVTMDGDKTITVTFNQLRDLTITNPGTGSGTVTAGPGTDAVANPGGNGDPLPVTYTYEEGDTVDLSGPVPAGSPAPGSIWKGWGGDVVTPGLADTQVNMTGGNKSVTATFNQQWTITVISGTGGAVSPGTVTLEEGADQVFTITPNAFLAGPPDPPWITVSDVEVDDVSVAGSTSPASPSSSAVTYTFTNVTDNHTLEAFFTDYGQDCGSATFIAGTGVVRPGELVNGDHPTRDGEVFPEGDEDWFEFEIKDAGTILIYTEGRIDTEGFLKDENCNDIASNDDKSPLEPNFFIQQDLSPGIYHVVVRHIEDDRNFPTGSGPYTLHVEFDIDDHGDSCSDQPTPLPCGGSGIVVSDTGEIENPGDVDAFEITVGGVGKITVWSSDATGSLNPRGELYNANCPSLGESPSLLRLDDDSAGNGNFWIQWDVDPGTYYLYVKDSADSGTGTYTVNLQCDLEHIITASAEFGGLINPTGQVKVVDTEDQTFTITPTEGGSIAQLLVDGVEVVGASGATGDYTYTFTNVTENHTITVSFNLPPGACVDISDVPLDARFQGAPPIIMWVLDDSGSMDWEFLTPELNGTFTPAGATYYYVFDNAGDNAYGGSHILPLGSKRQIYRAQWSEYNKLYYNPDIEYVPWARRSSANVDTPQSHPEITDKYFFNLSDVYNTVTGVGGGPGAVFVDDLDAGNSKSSGWNYWTGPAPFEGSDYYTSTVGAWFQWAVPSEVSGEYEVWAYNDPAYEYGNDQAAFYEIKYGAGGADEDSGDHPQSTGDGWVQLGTYTFDGDSGNYVRVTRDDNKTKNRNWTNADAIRFLPPTTTSLDIPNAHYYTWSDVENKPFLVIVDAGTIRYFEVNDPAAHGGNDDGVADGNEMAERVVGVNDPPSDVVTGRTYLEERQNFANWYQYYRRRELTMTAAASRVIEQLEGVLVGVNSINKKAVQPVLKIKVGGVDQTEQVLNTFYNMNLGRSNTPLRRGLIEVGQYLHTSDGLTGDIGQSPYYPEDEGGSCQQAFTIAITDGFWNGAQVPDVGNSDGDNDTDFDGPPYADNWSKTLADGAMYYYERDLAPGIADELPTNEFDSARHQHMVTYGVAFGVSGTLDPDEYDSNLININTGNPVVWPDPTQGNATGEKIDDLWHAAANGRGVFLNASNPAELAEALLAILQNIEARIGSASSVSINGDELFDELAGDIRMFQASFATDGWSGDVKAFQVDTDPESETFGDVITSSYIWSARDELDSTNWINRIIATYDGADGIPFRFDANLPDAMKDLLATNGATTNAALAQDVLNYIRGDDSNERPAPGIFRKRAHKLGDIVHSSPLFWEGVLYAGGNDGMLHAFSWADGTELFAYVPKLVFANLDELTKPFYLHRYFVDLTPTAAEIQLLADNDSVDNDKDSVVDETGELKPLHLLVGGLGKGGKGYYALNITDADTIASEGALADRVMWEYPNDATVQTEKDDMGFSFSRPSIVNSTAGYIVIFGNGYNSETSRAKLIILDAVNGTLLRSIDTEVANCNGLSTPIAVDVDSDKLVDYVYAGDLRGNMWKFDLTDADYNNWDVAYVDVNDDDGDSDTTEPRPLFQGKNDSGLVQPITTKPDVMFHCERNGYLVLFGTGRHLGDTDLTATTVHTIYGIWDYGDDVDDSEYLGAFSRTVQDGFRTSYLSNDPAADPVNDPMWSLVEQEVILSNEADPQFFTVDGTQLRVITDNPVDWKQSIKQGANCTGVGDLGDCDRNDVGSEPDPALDVGWYFDLPISGERVASDVLLRGQNLIAISTIPEQTFCGAGGSSVVMEMEACSGGRVDDPIFDINNDGVIDEQDMINVGTQENPIWVSPTGIRAPGRLLPPAILRMTARREMKYFSTSSGNIQQVLERSLLLGVSYWMEME